MTKDSETSIDQEELMKGNSRDSNLVKLLALIFDDTTAEHGFSIISQRDPLSDSITGDFKKDSWRTWRIARRLMCQSRFFDAFRALTNLKELHRPKIGQIDLANIELMFLAAELYKETNNPNQAYATYQVVIDVLFHYVNKIQEDSKHIADEIQEMLVLILGESGLQLKASDKEVISSWAVSRGLTLLLESSQKSINILSSTRRSAKKLATRLINDVKVFHDITNSAFSDEEIVTIETTLGNCWTEIDPKQALKHFQNVVNIEGFSTGKGITASVNAANCLLRLHQYEKAAGIYGMIESHFELNGDYLSAARVWAAECIAKWQANGDQQIRPSLVGAIKMFEENIAKHADVMTLYTQKKYMESAYQLMISIISESVEHDEEQLNQLLGCIWALLSRDFKANLEPDVPKPGWETILHEQMRPLNRIKNILVKFPGVGVLHVFPTLDPVDPSLRSTLPPNANPHRLVWVLYGYDRSGRFCFELSVHKSDQATDFFHFLDTLDKQLDADVRGDILQVQTLEKKLIEIADRFSKQFHPKFVQSLLSMDHLYYMPHPSTKIDEFPIVGLRFDGEWFNDKCTITRSSTINYLMESLNPNKSSVKANKEAIILTGNLTLDGGSLKEPIEETKRVEHQLGVYGFHTKIVKDATHENIRDWMDGKVGVVHYIGHGLSNNVYEGLPLPNGDVFTPKDIVDLSKMNLPFVFICACEAARIRHGLGGYQTGIASSIASKAAPAVIAFNMPITENRAYTIVRAFYREAFSLPFGQAMQAIRKKLAKEKIPAYAWLSLSAYGDPTFNLAKMAKGDHVGALAEQGKSWHSKLRSYSVLRDQSTYLELKNEIDLIPPPLRGLVKEFLEVSFQNPPISTIEKLEELADRALSLDLDLFPELLSLRSAIILEKAHTIGMDDYPFRWPETPEITKKLAFDLNFVARVGGLFFDMRLNGLAHALFGRLITWDHNSIKYSFENLREGIEKLDESASESQFINRIQKETIGILNQFGVDFK